MRTIAKIIDLRKHAIHLDSFGFNIAMETLL